MLRDDVSANGRFRIVVIAASRGGIDALSRILSQLTPAFPAAIAVVQHRATSSPKLLAQILQHGGLVICQDEDSARNAGMPRSAIAAGEVDYVLPLAYIASTLEELVLGGSPQAER